MKKRHISIILIISLILGITVSSSPVSHASSSIQIDSRLIETHHTWMQARLYIDLFGIEGKSVDLCVYDSSGNSIGKKTFKLDKEQGDYVINFSKTMNTGDEVTVKVEYNGEVISNEITKAVESCSRYYDNFSNRSVTIYTDGVKGFEPYFDYVKETGKAEINIGRKTYEAEIKTNGSFSCTFDELYRYGDLAQITVYCSVGCKLSSKEYMVKDESMNGSSLSPSPSVPPTYTAAPYATPSSVPTVPPTPSSSAKPTVSPTIIPTVTPTNTSIPTPTTYNNSTPIPSDSPSSSTRNYNVDNIIAIPSMVFYVDCEDEMSVGDKKQWSVKLTDSWLDEDIESEYPGFNLSYTVRWESKKDDVATVDADGNVTAKRKGVTSIIAYIDYGGKKEYKISERLDVKARNVKYATLKSYFKSKEVKRNLIVDEKKKDKRFEVLCTKCYSGILDVFEKYGYMEGFYLYPKVVVEKSKGTTKIKLKVDLIDVLTGNKKDYRDYNRLQFKKGKMSVSFPGNIHSNRYIENGVWCVEMTGYFSISTKAYPDFNKLYTLQSLVNKKHVRTKIYEQYDEAYAYCHTSKWKYFSLLIDYYIECLNRYGIYEK